MEPTRQGDTVEPGPLRDATDASAPAFGSLAIGVLTVVSPFVTVPLWASSPLGILAVGAILGALGLWLGVRAVSAPKGSPGRGVGIVGIVVTSIGILFSVFLTWVASILNSDPPL